MPPRTLSVRDREDIRAFFDRLAPAYADSHGAPGRALRQRLALIERLLAGSRRETLVEIGCGTGLHLFPLAGAFARLIGTDLSPGMIARAESLRRQQAGGERIAFRVGPAESLATVGDGVADAVLCVGALEHMPDRDRVLSQVARVLRPGGVFVCLTPNGDHVWYRWLAPRLGLPTRHLSSDRFLRRAELRARLPAAGLRLRRLQGWSFIPRGDMPAGWAWLMTLADACGRWLGFDGWRGGLAVLAVKPPACGLADRADG